MRLGAAWKGKSIELGNEKASKNSSLTQIEDYGFQFVGREAFAEIASRFLFLRDGKRNVFFWDPFKISWPSPKTKLYLLIF